MPNSHKSLFEWCKNNGEFGDRLLLEFSNNNVYNVHNITYGSNK